MAATSKSVRRDLFADKAAGEFAGVITSTRDDARRDHKSAGYQSLVSNDFSVTCECGEVFEHFITWERHAHHSLRVA